MASESEGVFKISFCVPSVRRLCLRILGAAGGGGGVDAEDVSEVLDCEEGDQVLVVESLGTAVCIKKLVNGIHQMKR